MLVNQIQKTLEMSYKTQRPVIFLSAPGVGKSDSVYQFAKTKADENSEPFGVIEVRGSMLSPAEAGDIKAVIDGKVVSLSQDWIPTDEKVEAGECPAKGIVFLDEIFDAMPSVVSVLQQLLLDRKLGSAVLASGWHTVGCSNRLKDKAASTRPSTAVINRCMVVTVEPDADIFYDWAIENGIDVRVTAFVRFRPKCVHDFDPAARKENPAFCSPRSLHIASDLVKSFGKDFPEDLKLELLSGALGDGVGSEFYGFMGLMNELPDLNKIIKDPDNYPVPEKTDVLIATVYALMNRITDKNMEDILRFFVRVPTEISVVAMRDTIKEHPSVGKTDVFKKWASKKIDFLV
jgi:hypothetical protein